jgi:Na+/proline symporter
MHPVDWIILIAFLTWLVTDGIKRTTLERTTESYFLANRSLPWWAVGLSVMATQLSAITLVGTTGQGYADGLRFVQFYFGLPLAMIILSVTLVPFFHRARVYTAYEYLEQRFDVRVRTLGALLFLIQRGLAAGITIYAPSIILSTILGLPLYATNLVIGLSVIAYTVSGGSKAVSQTQKHQMVVILLGMFAAGIFLFSRLPAGISPDEAAALAVATGRMNVVDTSLSWDSRYNIWSGIAGGFFLALSYFGTDQSQVQR